MSVSIKSQSVVRGGGTGYDIYWVPDTIEIGRGETKAEFFELNGSRSHKCATFFLGGRKDIQQSGVIAAFAILKHARNEKVNELLLEQYNKEMDLGELADKLDTLPATFNRHRADPNRYPPVIEVGLRSGDIIPVLFEICATKNVCVELTEETLTRVIAHVHAVFDEDGEAMMQMHKRKRTNASVTNNPLVRTNWQRSTLISFYRDSDGRRKRITSHPASLHIESIVQQNVEWHMLEMKRLHHIEVDGNWIFADAVPACPDSADVAAPADELVPEGALEKEDDDEAANSEAADDDYGMFEASDPNARAPEEL